MFLFAGDGEDGEGDRGAEVEGVGGCGGAEEAFQECQVSNHNDDHDGFQANSHLPYSHLQLHNVHCTWIIRSVRCPIMMMIMMVSNHNDDAFPAGVQS